MFSITKLEPTFAAGLLDDLAAKHGDSGILQLVWQDVERFTAPGFRAVWDQHHKAGGRVEARYSPSFGSITWIIENPARLDDGPSIEVFSCGELCYQYWTVVSNRQGVYHRDGAPAIIGKDTWQWHQYGKRHREDGPAVRNHGGLEAFYLCDKLYSKSDWQLKVLELRYPQLVKNAKAHIGHLYTQTTEDVQDVRFVP